MSLSRMHIMSSNQRLINKIYKDIFEDADIAWNKMYAPFCKRQADLNQDGILQFKYKGVQYKLAEDVMLRGGVKTLHKDLEEEFYQIYKMFVEEVDEEKRILKNMLAHAIRIAKYTEDLIDILPPIMHDSINEAGFFQAEDKPYMSVEAANQFKEYYGKYFGLFDLRKSIGVLM